MQEETKYKRVRCEKLKSLKSLKLYRPTKLDNENKEQEKQENKKDKSKFKKLFKNNSCQNIFNNILKPKISKRKSFSPKTKIGKNENVYEIEKGIVKDSLCLYSKNKYHFGTTRIMNPNCFPKEPNLNASTKMTEQNNMNFTSNFKRRFLLNDKPSSFKKIDKNIKIIKNNNKTNIYKKYNNNTGLDRHIVLSRSCRNYKSDNDYNTLINNSTKEDISKLGPSKNNFYLNNNKEKNNSLSTLYYQNNKNISNKLFNSTIFQKGESSKEQLNTKKKLIKKKFPKNKYTNRLNKYHFVMNTHLINLVDKNNLPEEIKILNFNKNALNVLRRENEKLFSKFRSIVPISKFSEKFRDPLNNSFDRELEQERKIKEKNNIKKDILPGIKLLKEMDFEIEKRKIIKKILKGKPLMHKIKKIIIRNVEYIKRLNVSYEEIIYKYKIYPNPFHFSKTEELILAIRNKNYDLCCDILDNFKYIVLDYDYFNFTPLHWAAKVNFYQIIPKLISYGSSVNEQNFMGETPLHISAQKTYYESTALLLIYLASPFIKNKNNRKPIDCTKDVQLIYIFKKIMELHLKYLISKQKYFFDNVQKDFIDFVSVEFSNQLNPEALALITFLK